MPSSLLILMSVLFLLSTTYAQGGNVTIYLVDSLSADGLADCNGHGSLMRSTIRLYAPEVKFVYLRTTDDNCQEQTFLYSAAFFDIHSNLRLPAIISVSGGFYADALVLPVVDDLLRAGATIFAAAGNDGTSDCFWPAIQPGVIAVQAVTSTAATQKFSNFCVRKNRTEVQWATACSTSLATATLAGRAAAGMLGSYVIAEGGECTPPSTLPAQWLYLGPTIGGVVGGVFFCTLLYLFYIFVIKGNPCEAHPRCLHPCS